MNDGERIVINPTATDYAMLEKCRQRPSSVSRIVKSEIADTVNMKPWGYEFSVFENTRVSVWLISLREGPGTSTHCHATTASSLLALRGTTTVKSLSAGYDVTPLGVVDIEPTAFHSVSGLTDAVVLEALTPPDRLDLYRLYDNRGNLFDSNVSDDYYSDASVMNKANASLEFNLAMLPSSSPQEITYRRIGDLIIALGSLAEMWNTIIPQLTTFAVLPVDGSLAARWHMSWERGFRELRGVNLTTLCVGNAK